MIAYEIKPQQRYPLSNIVSRDWLHFKGIKNTPKVIKTELIG